MKATVKSVKEAANLFYTRCDYDRCAACSASFTSTCSSSLLDCYVRVSYSACQSARAADTADSTRARAFSHDLGAQAAELEDGPPLTWFVIRSHRRPLDCRRTAKLVLEGLRPGNRHQLYVYVSADQVSEYKGHLSDLNLAVFAGDDGADKQDIVFVCGMLFGMAGKT